MDRMMGWVTRAEEILLCGVLLEMAILSFVTVVMRYCFGTSITWSEELLRYQICLVAFFGADVGLKHGSHIKAEVVNLFVSSRIKHLLSVLVSLAVFSFCFVFTYYGVLLIARVAATGQTTAATQIPKHYIYLPIAVGGALMCIRTILGMIVEFQRFLFPEKTH